MDGTEDGILWIILTEWYEQEENNLFNGHLPTQDEAMESSHHNIHALLPG